MDAKSLGDVLRIQSKALGSKSALLYPGAGGFESISYEELWQKARGYAGVLRELGILRGDKVVLQCENCVEWALLDWACRGLGVVLVPIYPTLPPDQSQFIATNCEAKLIVAGSPEQAEKTGSLAVRTLLLRGEDSMASRAASDALSEADWNAEVDKCGLDDLATIIYTSGTTGNPKGAMLSHRAFLHVCIHAKKDLPIWTADDTFLTFLPMSHVYERVAGQTLPIYLGATIAYAKSLASLANDIVAVRPTIMLCVPRFLEATMDKIVDGTKKMAGLQRWMFNLTWKEGAKKADGKFSPLAGLLDKIVGAKLRARMGGRIKFFVSGGAALPGHVYKFYSAFGLTILQGWGLTETAGGTCVNHPSRNKYWTVGEPLGMDIRIAEDGEILVKGPALMSGYFNLPEATAEAIDEQGWFHTGDIGEFEGPNLKITDRKKDLLVLANGKNVAPQPIENKLKEQSLIAEAVVFGDGNEYCYALIIPNFERLAAELGEAKLGHQDVLASESAKALIKAQMDTVNRGLADFEKVKKYALIDATFSIDSGELTPSLKVKRKVVREKFADVLSGLVRN